MIASELIPTARAVVDVNRPCNAKCRMCYYAHSNENWSKPLEKVKEELLAAKERGNTSVDFTGGEPTIHPQMTDIIAFSESIGLHTCIITNGLALERIQRLSGAGCREWLVSLHGFEGRHDDLLNVQGAWNKVNQTVSYLNQNGCFIRVNCTLTRYNTPDLPKLARHYIEYVNPGIVNFINFNPHYQWGEQDQPEIYNRLNEVQIRVSEVSPYLKEALDILNEKNLWANVRYFPFCRLKGCETHICNNPQVMFDPYEWDYGVAPKTTERYLEHGRRLQQSIGSSEEACGQCGILNVCGGIHRNYAKFHGYSELESYSEQSDEPYYFKKDVEADIIIPVYEPNANLQQLLSELVEKSIPPYNIIVADRRQSAARNRNCGLSRSHSPYVIMCDDDITNLPYGWNRHMIDVLKQSRHVTALSARLLNKDGSAGRNTANNFDLSRPVVTVSMIPTACCVFRRTDLRFDERYVRAGWEDTDFFMQMKAEYGGRLAILNGVQVVHLNEEKNVGGVGNDYNRRLFQQKWEPEQARSETPAVASAESDDVRVKIRKYLEQGDLTTAVLLIQKAIGQSSDGDGELYDYLGYACWQLGEQKRALECFHQAVLLRPDDGDIWANFVDAAYQLSEFKIVEDYLKDVIQANPEMNEYRYILAGCLYKQEKHEEAKDVLMVLLRKDNSHVEARRLLEEINAKGCSRISNCGCQDELSIDIRTFNRAKFITRRGCIDIGHICDIDCLFCYHRFEDRGKRRFLTKEQIMERMKRDREQYEIEVTDFTGGEPTIHPDIVEIVRYGNEIGNRICIISHGQWRKMDRIDAVIDAGIHEFLISIHGVQEDHDRLTNPGAFERIMNSIGHLEKRNVKWRANCVANALNMKRLPDYAKMLTSLSYPPGNANFIVFSPLAGWHSRKEIDFQAKHAELAPYLKEAIGVFSGKNVWTNVRYYPMCMLPGLEKHITCFPQICYDPFEWDYRSYSNADASTIREVYKKGKEAGIYAETEDNLFHNAWSLMQSQRCYRKAPQCVSCRLRLICDGVAAQYMERYGFDELAAQPGELIQDPIHFRRLCEPAVGSSRAEADRNAA
ncbi:MAG: radical SAM protein [Pseudomonadota bacterium]